VRARPIDKEWAWGGASGAGITVAVVDSGIDAGHPAVGRVERAVALQFAGVVLVCATNNVPGPTFPSQFSSVISVAAHDGQDPFCLDANPAPPTDFGAPGIDIRVPWLAGATILSTGNSFAAPHVTGLAARLLSKHPYLTPYEVKTVLRAVSSNATSPEARL
jgi:subtilisin